MAPVEQILSELRAGTAVEGNLERLFRRYYPMVRKNLAARGLSHEIAEELSQEVFIAVYRHHGGLPTDRRAFHTWLFKTVRRKYLTKVERWQRLKRSAPVVALDESRNDLSPVDQEPDSETRILREERIRRLRGAMMSLPPRQRECLELQAFQELGIAEIGIVLGIAPGTVKAHLFNARRALKEKLADDFDGFDPDDGSDT